MVAGGEQVRPGAEGAAAGDGHGADRRGMDALEQCLDPHHAQQQVAIRQAFQIRQVEAGAEVPALATQDDKAGAGDHGPVEGLRQMLDQFGAEGIAAVGAIEAEGGDGLGGGREDHNGISTSSIGACCCAP